MFGPNLTSYAHTLSDYEGGGDVNMETDQKEVQRATFVHHRPDLSGAARLAMKVQRDHGGTIHDNVEEQPNGAYKNTGYSVHGQTPFGRRWKLSITAEPEQGGYRLHHRRY